METRNTLIIREHFLKKTDFFKNMFFCSFLFRKKNRYRLTSASDDDDYDEDVHPIYDDQEEHRQYIPARDHLPEFPGRIPPRKKRDTINSQPRKSRVSTLQFSSIK